MMANCKLQYNIFYNLLNHYLHFSFVIIICIILFYSNKIEKEKKQLAKEAGMLKTEVTGPEVGAHHDTWEQDYNLRAYMCTGIQCMGIYGYGDDCNITEH